MSDLITLLNQHRSFSEKSEAGELNIRPRLSTIVLTCLDARVEPAQLFKLELGDALVMRNAGGRITPAVMRDLAILSVLAANLPGAGGRPPELAIIHHTDCGMARLADGLIQHQVAQRLDLTDYDVAAMAVVDPTATVQSDIERLRQAPGAPDALVVSGLVYDVRRGTIEQVVSTGPLLASQVASDQVR